jgi:hypothetical protein
MEQPSQVSNNRLLRESGSECFGVFIEKKILEGSGA